ncbi:MAG TPA: hypothetical protein VFY76_07540 [Nocardioides sp.]|nr:hypothetical protein [Nocardioides sp.]
MDAEHPLVLAIEIAVAASVMLFAALAWARSRATSVLLATVGLTWLAGFVIPIALFWHRAVLVHALAAYPGWRPRSGPGLAVVVATYVVCVLFPAAWFDDRATLVLALVLAVVASWQLLGARGRARHRLSWAFGATVLLSAVLVCIAVVRVVVGPDLWFPALVAYDAAVVAVAAILCGGLREPDVERLTDLVVDLADAPAGPVGGRLARALGDPDLVVASWDRSRKAFLGADGEQVPTTVGAGRTATRLDRDGEPFLLLVHDATLADDRRLREAVATAARIGEVNTSWQGEVAARAEEVAASRRRLVDAADDERRRLEAELRAGVEARLGSLAELLECAPPGEHRDRATELLARTRGELAELASGLRPRALAGGLGPALLDLASASPVPAEVTVRVTDVPADVALTAYYVSAEALTNVAKHAPGACARIVVTAGRSLVVEVADDGPGGAQPVTGGGLAGLRDRVEAQGGRLVVTTGATGTRVVAELPLPRAR